MRSILILGHNDLRLFLRNRASWVWLFVMPLVFVYFMGAANRGPGSPSGPRPALVLDNRDPGFLGAALVEELGTQGLSVVSPTNAAGATRSLRVPPDFTEAVLAGRQSRLHLTARESGVDAAAALVELRVLRAVIGLNSRLLEQATSMTGAPPTLASLAALRAQPDPVSLDARFAGRRPIPTGFNLSLPGVMVMYAMMNLLVLGGSMVAWERRGGLLRRVSVQPVPRFALIAGKIYGLMLLAAVQTAFLLVTGRFLFGVNLGDELAGILLVLLVYSWVAAALGVLVGSTVRGEDRVVGLCVLLSIVMAALGGCWWPLEIVPEHVRIAAHCIPTGWAMDALHQLITFGSGLSGAYPALAALGLFGTAFTLAAVRWFRV